jgi:hypothetical protein
VCEPISQAGAAAVVQSALFVQPTHVAVGSSQTFPLAAQWVSFVHATHVAVLVLQAGVAPSQC